MAVFTPITSPRALTSGPPELPGFSAASVWMMLSISRPDWPRSERPSPLTMPAVEGQVNIEASVDDESYQYDNSRSLSAYCKPAARILLVHPPQEDEIPKLLWRDSYYTARLSSSDYDHAPDFTDPTKWEPIQKAHFSTMYVQPGHYLCLGDNSQASSDSRDWGLVPERLMLGRALLVYFPFNRAGVIE